MPNETSTTTHRCTHRWKFTRIGGLDQVSLETADDLLNLRHLDQKLWVALSCPVRGLELDEKTLALIDTDGDGRIHVPELLAALDWLRPRLADPASILKPAPALPLAAINEKKPEGAAALAAAKQILSLLGKPAAAAISVEDTSDPGKIFARTRFNGDGIIPADAAGADEAGTATAAGNTGPGNPAAAGAAELKQLIADIIDTQGAATDLSGRPGIDLARLDRFYADIAAHAAWAGTTDPAIRPLGAGTAAAHAALNTVRAKIDDYFARCRLAAYDPRAAAVLNRTEADYAALAAQDLLPATATATAATAAAAAATGPAAAGSATVAVGSSAAGPAAAVATTPAAAGLAAFPLAHAAPDRPLPLAEGVNPAWAAALREFHALVVTPLLGTGRTALAAGEWAALAARFAPCETWLAARAGESVARLGPDRIRRINTENRRDALAALIARDLAAGPQAPAIAAVERLARYHRDLGTLLRNFVNFHDFYGPSTRGVFQAGTLYLDARGCALCVRVDDPAAHSVPATLSHVYIAYCDLRRSDGATMKIAACLTQGDSDYLIIGRNGLFYDTQGRDWDATITKIVENPISVRQAFWSPYKRFVRFIEEHVAKHAAAADAASAGKLNTATAAALSRAGQPPAGAAAPPAAAADAPPGKIDIGTVAALGVAVGAIGGALGAIATGLARLAPWQLPLVLLAVMLAISLPSMLIAWLKLRQRTLGPILDATGWAVNGRVKINFPLGAALTDRARLPPGAKRVLKDPFADKAPARRRRWLILILLSALAVLALHRDHHRRGRYFWQSPPAPVEAAATPPVEGNAASEK
ncbi:MAG: hypothetical protein LBC18_05725 [Opitutaceae bacterium]|jgi:hypothetical protein|nr:hypothetical protein [Opitutaceae bacterium]